MIDQACLETVKQFAAETFGAGVGTGVVLTIVLAFAGKTVIEWMMTQWKSRK